jgi:aminocarboxymuconate-semialdehyde decarboxylase
LSVDVHNHAIPQRVLNLVAKDSRYGVTLKDGYWESNNIGRFEVHAAWYDPDAKLREMDDKELDGAVLSVAPKPLYCYEMPLEPQALVARETNLGLAEFSGKHPDRLKWMAHVPLAFPDEAATVLREAVGAGAVGAQLGTSAAGHRLDEPRYDPFWEAVEDLKVPMFIHPAYEQTTPEMTEHLLNNVIGLPYETTIALERMICAHTFDRFPSLRIVAAHGGGFFPWSAGRLRNYIKLRPALKAAPTEPWSYVGRIKFDSKLDDIATLKFLIDKAGAENVMIGTDCSFQSSPKYPARDVLAALGDNRSADALAILSTNANEWFESALDSRWYPHS